MGLVCGKLLNAFKSKIPEERVIDITDKIFDRLMEDAKKRIAAPSAAEAAPPAETPPLPAEVLPLDMARAVAEDSPSPPEKFTGLSFQDLHSAVIQVFEEVNKHIPGANCQPPSRERVEEILKQYDDNQDGHIDRYEFRKFVHKFAADLVGLYAKDVLVMTVAVPTAALMTKAATQSVPVVGSLIAKIPGSIIAVGATFAALAIRNLSK